MDYLAVDDVVVGTIEVRQSEPAQFANGGVERLAARTATLAAPLPAQCAQCAQHLRAVEPLTLTVLAKTHGPIMTRYVHRGAQALGRRVLGSKSGLRP